MNPPSQTAREARDRQGWYQPTGRINPFDTFLIPQPTCPLNRGKLIPDEWAWWDWVWSAGLRALLERLSPSDLEELRREAFSEVAALRTPDGVPLHQRARFVIAQRPR